MLTNDRVGSWLDRLLKRGASLESQNPGLGLQARFFFASICLLGLFFALQPPDVPVSDPFGLMVFILLGGLAQLTPIRFSKNASVSLGMAMALGTIMVFGPAYAAWVNLSGGLVHYLFQNLPKKRPLYRSAVTTATLVIAAVASGWVYRAAGGHIGANSDYFGSLLAVGAAGLTYYVVNTTLITAAMALEQGQKYLPLLGTQGQWVILNIASMTPLAIGIAVFYQKIGWAGLAVYLIPIGMARYSFQLYARSVEDVQRANEDLKGANDRVLKMNEELNEASEHLHRANKELIEANGRLNVMYEVSRSLTGSLHRDEMFERVLTAMQLMGFSESFAAGPMIPSKPPVLNWHTTHPAYQQWVGAENSELVQTDVAKLVASACKDAWFLTREPRVVRLDENASLGVDGKALNKPQAPLPFLTLVPLHVRDTAWAVIGFGSARALNGMEIKEILIFRSMVENVLEMVLAHEQAELDALVDTRTGLYNHRYLQEALQRVLQDATQRNSYAALLMIDINNFKEFNDRFGHQLGDQILAAVGGILRENVREGDIACRFGGDEFCVLLPHADRARGIEVASRIDRAVRTFPFQIRQETVPNHDGSQTISLTVSIGVAAFPEAALTRAGLLEQADRACYRAKALGGGVVAEAGIENIVEDRRETGRSIRLHLFKGPRPPNEPRS